MASTQSDRDMRVLEYIYDNANGRGADALDLRDLIGYDALLTTITGLERRGLVRSDGRLSPAYFLTSEGRVLVEDMLARRDDFALRMRECRNLLLRWVARRAPSEATRASRADFDAEIDLLPFTEEEKSDAADYLARHDLVGTISSNGADHHTVWVTPRGRECLGEGGDVGAFTRTASAGSQHINVNAPGATIAASLGAGSSATAHHTAGDPEAVRMFAAVVVALLPYLNLSPTDTEQITLLAAEAEHEDDPTRSQRAAAAMRTIAVGGASGLVGDGLIAIAKAFGIPL